MSLASARTEQVYVTRATRNMLEALALLHVAAQPEGAEGPSIGSLTDAMADSILRQHLNDLPHLREQQREIAKAIGEIKARYAQQQP